MKHAPYGENAKMCQSTMKGKVPSYIILGVSLVRKKVFTGLRTFSTSFRLMVHVLSLFMKF